MPQTHPADGPWRVSAMLRRRPDLDAREAAAEIRATLAPAIARALGNDDRLLRLVVERAPDRVEPAIAGLFPPLHDGLVHLHFGSAADAGAGLRVLGRNDAVRTIAQGLIDRQRSTVWLARVFALKPGTGTSGIRFVAGGDIADGWDMAAAQAYWRDVHPEVAQTAAGVWESLTRYVQFHGVPVEPDAPADTPLGSWRCVAMCAEMGFARPQDFIATYSSPGYLAIVRPDEEKFSRPGEMLAFICGEADVLIDRTVPVGGSVAAAGG